MRLGRLVEICEALGLEVSVGPPQPAPDPENTPPVFEMRENVPEFAELSDRAGSALNAARRRLEDAARTTAELSDILRMAPRTPAHDLFLKSIDAAPLFASLRLELHDAIHRDGDTIEAISGRAELPESDVEAVIDKRRIPMHRVADICRALGLEICARRPNHRWVVSAQAAEALGCAPGPIDGDVAARAILEAIEHDPALPPAVQDRAFREMMAWFREESETINPDTRGRLYVRVAHALSDLENLCLEVDAAASGCD